MCNDSPRKQYSIKTHMLLHSDYLKGYDWLGNHDSVIKVANTCLLGTHRLIKSETGLRIWEFIHYNLYLCKMPVGDYFISTASIHGILAGAIYIDLDTACNLAGGDDFNTIIKCAQNTMLYELGEFNRWLASKAYAVDKVAYFRMWKR